MTMINLPQIKFLNLSSPIWEVVNWPIRKLKLLFVEEEENLSGAP